MLNFSCCYDNPLKHRNNLSITSKIYNFLKTKQIHLTLQVFKKFRVFRVFDFSIRGKVENWETSEISNFLQQSNYKPWKNFQVFRVFDFSIRAKIKTWKPWKARKARNFFSEFSSSEFSILGIRSKSKSRKRKSRKQNSELSEVSEFSTWPLQVPILV